MGLALIAPAIAQDYTRQTLLSGYAWPYQRKVVPTFPNGGTIEFLTNGAWSTEGANNRMTLNGTTEKGYPVSTNVPGTLQFGGTQKTITWRWAGQTQTHSFVISCGVYTVAVPYSSSPVTATLIVPDLTASFDFNTNKVSVTSTERGDIGPAVSQEELTLLLTNDTGVPQQIMWGDELLTLQPGVNAIRYDGPVDANGTPTVGPQDLTGRFITGPDGRKYFASSLIPSGLDSGEVRWTFPIHAQGDPNATAGSTRYEILSQTSGGTTVIIHRPDGSRIITTLPNFATQTGPLTTGGTATLSNPTEPNAPPNTTNTVTNTTNNYVNNTSTTVTNNYGAGTGNSSDSTVGELNGAGEAVTDTNYNADVPTMPTDLESDLTGARDGFTTKIGAYNVLASGSIPKIDNYSITYNCGPFGSLPINVDFSHPAVQTFRAFILVCFTLVLSATLIKRLKV